MKSLARLPARLRPAAHATLARLGHPLAPHPPTQVHLSVTDRCFLPCLHCDIHRSRARDLPTARWEAIVDDLAAWLGPVAANFVGGEPLLRPDLESLMSRATVQGFQVSFNTNGWLLTRSRAERLSDAGVAIAYVSLDGMDPTLVDHTRGRAGAWRRAREAITHLEAVGRPRVIVATILHGRNAAEIPALLDFVRDRGHQLVVQPLAQNFGPGAYDPGWYRRSSLWPDEPSRVGDALDLLADERRAGGPVCNSIAQLNAMKGYFQDPSRYNGRTCRAGHTDLAVDPQGRVRLCFNLPPVGSLGAGQPAEQVWTALATLRRRGEIQRCRRSCNLLNCNFEEDGPR